MFRAVTVRKSSFPRGSPDFHQSPGRTDPLNCRPVTTKNRSWNFSDLEIFSYFFSFALSLFFIRFHSSKSRLQRHYPVVGTWKNFSFFRTRTFFQLFLFFNFLTLSRFARRIDFISVDIKSHLSAKAQQLFDIF